ncbi:MAG: glycosyltransferase [Candidatus Gastranaerophilales bacterium]|nr:glycosyltransferase [Candidatus Gastranaerophilales bacterium]
MILLYITFDDMKEVNSGSSLRPQKMYQAFKALDLEVILLQGEQGVKDKAKRCLEIDRILNVVKQTKPDICYIESSTYPILFKKDISLIKQIHKMKVPMGYFYRDCYRKKEFRNMSRKKRRFGLLKDIYLDILQKRTDRVLRKVDIVYFPSELMTKYFSYDNMKLLPPAADLREDITHPFHKVAIYVGGISKQYGFDLMIDAFKILNQEETYKLILVCRESEIQPWREKTKELSWLDIHHVSGDDLLPLYTEASVALIPRLGGYNDFAVPVKLFEYLANGLPVVSTNVIETSKIISENKAGIVTRQDVEDFAEGIRSIFSDQITWEKMRERAVQTICEGNRWIDRARQVIDDLLNLKDN